MNIAEVLQSPDFNKKFALEIVDWIGENNARMAQLMEIYFKGPYRITQRAAYPLLFISDQKPQLFKPYLKEMTDFMTDDKHDAVIRNTLRLFQNIDLPEELEGILFDKCAHYLRSPKYPVAVRVFAMTILTNLAKKYPELSLEVLPLVEDVLQVSESPGMHSRGKKMLEILRRLRKELGD
jgi:hypothetical protein